MIKLFRRRRYVVQAFHPAEYAPNDQKRFHEAYQADDYMAMVRRSYPWTEFVVRDRKTGLVSRYKHVPRAH
ncbi:hypothetical protein SEA_CHOCOLAT_91 [Arthrobacter phage Chocolat]|uniref:Uncharacterized protein n=9 Tax=Klausavirus princesstrina TaxID=1984784 RepID=A0A286N4A4_9CAUD|nr:hypothetical protein SEA_CHOCOLAT_91 [Arthrobacter phage Chocolat]APC44885.1 hypothetical protein SEA_HUMPTYDUMPTY_91 [Arthrobacter phage HumptyDumpty]ASX98875.1 hypothetical protein SEA_KABREEZE_91 [Arthrobacter phage Kabreeze]ASX99099.1 hypothetical protein SEA_SCAVITO_92 [Arthrobacter phage Scavito]ASX99211.1 hypothetical protein SEA_TOPHAT_92 [Arthrobacter phage Tophat]ASZ73302.1 hypothetical protein SEA_JAYCOOKIE_91 [Arthrobacter phage JayCookie]QBP30463.1 hypothetical protein SEA_CHI